MSKEWNSALEAAAELCGTTAAIWSNGTLEEISSVSKAIKRAILALRRDDVGDEAVPVAWAIKVSGDKDSEVVWDSIWDHPQFAHDHVNSQFEMQADGFLPECKRSVVALYEYHAPNSETERDAEKYRELLFAVQRKFPQRNPTRNCIALHQEDGRAESECYGGKIMSTFFERAVQHKQNMELIKGLTELQASEAIAEDAAKEIARLKAELAAAQGEIAECKRKLETCEKLAQSVMNDLGGTA